MDLLSLDNPVFVQFVFYSSICVGQIFLLIFNVARVRMKTKSITIPEDAKLFGIDITEKDKPKTDHPDVLRANAALANAGMNIPLFVIVGLFYILTGPSLSVATWHFRIFTIGRFLHSLLYLTAFRAPFRSWAFSAGVFSTLSMLLQVEMTVWNRM